MPRFDLRCLAGHEQMDITIAYGERPPCPTCGAATEILWRTSFPNIIGDECDFTVTNFGPTPERFRSKADHRRRMKELGLVVKDSHVPMQGSDKSPHTKAWY